MTAPLKASGDCEHCLHDTGLYGETPATRDTKVHPVFQANQVCCRCGGVCWVPRPDGSRGACLDPAPDHGPHHPGNALMRPVVADVVPRFRAYRQMPGNGAWGSLHVVLADGNVRDGFVHSCIAFAQDKGDTEGAELGRILLLMSRTQRSKIARLAQ